MIKCEICGKEFTYITHAHLKHHNLSTKEYKEKYGEFSLVNKEEREKASKNLKGRINIGENNAAKRVEVRKKISSSVKNKWEEGVYKNRINGMLGVLGENHPNYKKEKHTPTAFAKDKYLEFLSSIHDVDTCFRCGKKTNKINIHHIDENHNNFLPSNLEPLCVPCHMSFHYKWSKQPFMIISKMFKFDAAHFLPSHPGLCKNIHGHGFSLKVSLKKRVDKKTGMVFDFSDLKNIVNKVLEEDFDHTLLNNVIDIPTAENIAVLLWEKLMIKYKLKGIYEIEIWESEGASVKINEAGMLSIFSTKIEDYLGDI